MLLSQTRRGCYRTHNSPLGQLIQKESQANNLSSCAKWPPGKTNNFQDTNSKSLLNPMEMNSPDYFTSTNPPNFKVPSTAEAGNNSCLKRGKNSARQFKTRKHIWEKSACPIRQVFWRAKAMMPWRFNVSIFRWERFLIYLVQARVSQLLTLKADFHHKSGALLLATVFWDRNGPFGESEPRGDTSVTHTAEEHSHPSWSSLIWEQLSNSPLDTWRKRFPQP